MVCPACLNSDKDDFTQIKQPFTVQDKGNYYSETKEIYLYVCNKCSCIMANHYIFNQKEDPNEKEEEIW